MILSCDLVAYSVNDIILSWCRTLVFPGLSGQQVRLSLKTGAMGEGV